ncbi:MAG: hypothetical protein JO053_06015 [Acidobacteria bacterium]|nr:hypothetical protein [Acidobacteriota bacterium]
MNKRDAIYQERVDAIARDLSALPIKELETRFEYGGGTATLSEKDFSYFRHSQADGTHRMVILDERKLVIGYRKYLSGVIWTDDGTIRTMTNTELDEYD